MTQCSRRLLFALTLGTVLLPSAAFAGGAGAPPAARPAKTAAAVVDGRALLGKAIEAHGGAALLSLRTARQPAEMTILDAKGNAALTLNVTVFADYVTNQVRLTIMNAGQVVSEQFVTTEGAFSHTPQSGTVPLPRAEAKDLNESFYSGLAGLRFGLKGRDSMKNLGTQTWLKLKSGDVKGTALEVVTKGMKATYLLNAQGRIIAERSPNSELGETISVYSDYRALGGIMWPYTTTVYAVNGMAISVVKEKGSQINVTLPTDTFKVPE